MVADDVQPQSSDDRDFRKNSWGSFRSLGFSRRWFEGAVCYSWHASNLNRERIFVSVDILGAGGAPLLLDEGVTLRRSFIDIDLLTIFVPDLVSVLVGNI